MRGLLRMARTLIWLLLALLASALLHLRTELGRDVGRDLLNYYVSSLIAGRLHVETIDELGLDRIVVRDVSLYDPEGTLVIYGEEIVLILDPLAARDGTLRFSHARMRRGRLRLETHSSGELTFLRALGAADPTPSEGPAFHAIVDDMHLEDVRAYGELLGLSGIYADGIHAHGRMEFEDEIVIQVYGGGGAVRAPFDYTGNIEKIVATINTDDRIGTDLYVRARTRDDRVRLRLDYALPSDLTDGPDTPMELDLRIYAEPVYGETLARSGFEWASILRGEIRGHVRLRGPTDHLRLEGRLRTEGGFVDLTGELPSEGDVVIRAESHALDLAGLIDGAPEVIIDGEIALRAPPGEDARFELQIKPFDYFDYFVPEIRARGRLLDTSVVFDELRGTDQGGVIEGSGSIGFDGVYDLRLEGALQQVTAEPNIAALVPELRGGMNFRASLRGSADRIELEGAARFRGFAYEPVSASTLATTGTVVVEDGLPRLDLRVEARDLEVSGVSLGTASAVVSGNRGRYRLNGSLRDAGGRTSRFESRLQIVGDELLADISSLSISRGGVTFSGTASGIRTGPSIVEVQDLSLASGSQRVEGSIRLNDHGPDAIDARLSNIALAELEQFLGPVVPAMRGTLDLVVNVRGEIDSMPQIALEGELRDVPLVGVEGSAVAFRAGLQNHAATFEAVATLADQGTLRAEGGGHVRGGLLGLEEGIAEGIYRATLSADALAVTVLRDALEIDASTSIDGHLTGSVDLEGAIRDPRLRGRFAIPDLELEDFPSVDARVSFRLDDGMLDTNVTFDDPHGRLLDAEATIGLDIPTTLDDPASAAEAIASTAWRLALRVPPRPLAEAPAPILAMLPIDPADLYFGASLTLAGGGSPAEGSLLASLDYRPEVDASLCGGSARPSATLVVDLRDGESSGALYGVLEGRRVFTARVRAATPLTEWIASGALPALPPTQLEATLHQAPAEGIPVICERLTGALDGSFTAQDLFTEAPALAGEIFSDRLRVRRIERSTITSRGNTIVETQPVKVRVGFGADAEAFAVSADMQWWNGGATHASALVASRWPADAFAPEPLEDATLEADLELHRMPLSAAVVWIPGIANVEGQIEGNASIRGTLFDPTFEGTFRVEGGQLHLRSLGQRLRNVHGRVVLSNEGIALEDFTAADSEGTTSAEGLLELEGLRLVRSTLEVHAASFPIRSEGTVMARLSGKARIENEFRDEGITGRVALEELTIALPEASGRTPQNLRVHPEVCVRRRGEDGRFGACEGEPEAPSEDAYEVSLEVDASRRFLVRSPDFEALVSARLTVRYRDPDLRVGGDVQFHRGNFQVFGRRFEVREGNMTFDPTSTTLNPSVLLVATHRIRNDPNRTITVHASGTLARPVVEFTSTVPTNNEGEIIALLITGSTRQRRETFDTSTQAAGEEAADFLAGVAFGVATLSLREEFGDRFPMIAVETADSGFRSARFRAGFTADKIIPERLRSIVEGVYIEGYYTARGAEDGPTTGGATTTGTGQDSGFLIELQFPRNIVGTGTYSPPSNWGMDVTWEP